MFQSSLVDAGGTSLFETALHAIDEAGLQAPSLIQLDRIIQFAACVTDMLSSAAVKEPSASELREFFDYCVVTAVNRAPGVGDAAAR